MDLTTITAHLSESRANRLTHAVEALEDGIKHSLVANIVFTEAKDTISRMVVEAAEAFLKTGPHAQGHHQSDWWLAAYHSDAFVSGTHTLPTVLRRATEATSLTEYFVFLTALMPLRDLLEQAKPLVRKKGDMPKVKTQKQIADEADQMTCQCCGRGIFAATGLIAHHGYERPGYGLQTASCYGARELPFEVSRDALGHMISMLVSRRKDMIAACAEIASERIGIERSWQTRVDHKRETHSFVFTRENLHSAEGKAAQRAIASYSDFDTLLKGEVASRDNRIASIAQDIKMQRERYANWKQTHQRVGDKWVEV